MRALKVSCGLDITLDLGDKEKINRGESLECPFLRQENLKLVLKVRNNVPWGGHMEETGFHIKADPKKVTSPKDERTYSIYLSKEIFDALTNPPGNPIVDGGYFVSRSRFDRVDIKYFAIHKPES